MRRMLAMIFIFLLLFLTQRASANELDDLTRQLSSLKSDLANKEVNYKKLSSDLAEIKSRVVIVEREIIKKEKEVDVGGKALFYQKELLNARARSYYKNSQRSAVSLVNFLIAENLSDSIRNFFYQKSLADEDKNAIIKIVLYIKNLEEKKASLVGEKIQLAALKVVIDEQSKVLGAEISQTKQKIAALSGRQQQLIAEKLASLNISRSAGTSARGCSNDLTNGRDPGFSPRLAFFTYGAPHRNGLNQYGALGRAKDNQNEEKILQEYYPNFSLKKDYDQSAQINVEGYGVFSIEDYVKRIYEMPDTDPWNANNLAALKAQAVAARSYALNTMQRKGSICTTEACQVFQPNPKGGNWEAAVEATKGWVLMEGAGPAFTQYASTHGGYILNLGKYDGQGGTPNSFKELNERAYDKDSPWFYCDWGARADHGGTAWLKPSEVADIANAILLARRDSSTGEHLYQTDKANPAGTDTWNEDRVRSELRARGEFVYDTVSDVSVGVDWGSGKTNSVVVSGSGQSTSFSGEEFKNWFNLRAPANIQIVGPLFNVEK